MKEVILATIASYTIPTYYLLNNSNRECSFQSTNIRTKNTAKVSTKDFKQISYDSKNYKS